MTAIFVFQHNAGVFLNTRVISGLGKMPLSIALSYSPLMRSEWAQAKPSLLLPTNQYLLQHRRRDRGWKTKKSSVSNDNFLSSPLFFQVLFIKSKWTTPDGSVLLPEELQQTERCYLLFSSPLAWSLCSSPIPSTDVQPPPTPLQTSRRGSIFIIVFVIAPHSFTAGSQLHLKGTKKNTVRGSAMTLELHQSRVQVRGRNLIWSSLEVDGLNILHWIFWKL